MDWKEALDIAINKKDWKSATELVRKTIAVSPNDVEAYIRGIYLLHDILLEQDYPQLEKERLWNLLRQYFNEANSKFASNAEYLFFVGKILYIGEWFFGIDDDLKPVYEKTAFKMQKKASDIEPQNALFEWAYRFSLGDELAPYLAQQILTCDDEKLKWLASRRFPGEYILDNLKYSAKMYVERHS